MVETLIATVFVTTILSVIYVNFFPLIGEYERREAYDDVDSKYGAFWIKKMIQDSNYIPSEGRMPGQEHYTPIELKEAYEITCDGIYSDNIEKKYLCGFLFGRLKVKQVFLTSYNIASFKTHLKNTSYDEYGFSDLRNSMDEEFKSYISYLPDYSVFQSYNNAKYRILVEFEHTGMKKGDGTNDSNYKTFATMEVSK